MESFEHSLFFGEDFKCRENYCSFSLEKTFNDENLKKVFTDNLLISVLSNDYLFGFKVKKIKNKAYMDLFLISNTTKITKHIFIDKLINIDIPKSLKNVDFSYKKSDSEISIKCENKKLVYKGNIQDKDNNYVHFNFYISESDTYHVDSGCGIGNDFCFKNRILYKNVVGYLNINGELFNFADGSISYIVLNKTSGFKDNFLNDGLMWNVKENRAIFLSHNQKFSEVEDDNVVFEPNLSYKLGKVRFYLALSKKGNDSFYEEWQVKSVADDVNLIFKPTGIFKLERKSFFKKRTDIFAFGHYSGKISNNGKEIIVDNELGFARKKVNK